MSKESLIILVGLLVFFTPSLGIPEDWKQYILLGSGVFLMLLGYILRRAAYLRSIDRGDGERGADSFVESSRPELNYEMSEEEPMAEHS